MHHVTAVEAMSITMVHIHLGPNSLDTGTLSVVIILRGLVLKLYERDDGYKDGGSFVYSYCVVIL